jgi:ADP-ribose pyrophosphatase YjhB (NUDIX family)
LVLWINHAFPFVICLTNRNLFIAFHQAGKTIRSSESRPDKLSNRDGGLDPPRWTLPPRKEISPENLHISSFVIVKKADVGGGGIQSILLVKAGDKHPLSFRRGKLLLPATILRYGENPRDGARRALKEQLRGPEHLKDPVFLTMQSYLGAHWDIVFLFETQLEKDGQGIEPNEPFVLASFHEVHKLPRGEVAEDHLEVIDGMLSPSDDV